MRENLEEMARQGLAVPVLLGGAALTRRYVDEDCANAYQSGGVAYARDAFDGLALMDKVVSGRFVEHLAQERSRRAGRPVNNRRRLGQPTPPPRPVDVEEIRLKRTELHNGLAVPTPPFWGAKMIEHVPVRALIPFLNERMLFQFHWGFRKQGKRLDEYMEWAQKEVRPILVELLQRVESEEILLPQAVYGYWKAASEGDNLVLFDETGRREIARFALPRQGRAGGVCVADFFRDVNHGADGRDVIGLQAVTVGQRASDVARQWFEKDRYQDYLYLHGFGVEMAEALAEYVHKRIRAELGFAGDDAREKEKLLAQGYRGSRYSFGYPAVPNLADQRILLDLLGADRIGLVLGEEDQLHPEQSTSAIVVHHPQAKYFSV
jgi:5-methyltetrahydrofolate--homocysteine methyltransferase